MTQQHRCNRCSRPAIGYSDLRWHCRLHAPWKLLKAIAANEKRRSHNHPKQIKR